MAVNKVIYGQDTLIDLTGDTVVASSLQNGKTAHTKDGSIITGTAQMVYNASTEELSVPGWMVVLEDG